MIITTLSSSTLLALVAYGFLTIIHNKCSAQMRDPHQDEQVFRYERRH